VWSKLKQEMIEERHLFVPLQSRAQQQKKNRQTCVLCNNTLKKQTGETVMRFIEDPSATAEKD